MSDPLSTQILCTADQQDEEPWRIERLQEVAALLSDLHILRLHDHEGTLSVHWDLRPKPEELVRVRQAWARQNEPYSKHFIDGVLIEEFEDDELILRR